MRERSYRVSVVHVGTNPHLLGGEVSEPVRGPAVAPGDGEAFASQQFSECVPQPGRRLTDQQPGLRAFDLGRWVDLGRIEYAGHFRPDQLVAVPRTSVAVEDGVAVGVLDRDLAGDGREDLDGLFAAPHLVPFCLPGPVAGDEGGLGLSHKDQAGIQEQPSEIASDARLVWFGVA